MSQDLDKQVISLAFRHGLDLIGALEFNEQGLDFRIVFAGDSAGVPWVLRIPRRPDVLPKAEYESRVLKFVKQRLSVQVPEWRIETPELIAYPRLIDKTALSFNPVTFEVHWNIDQNSEVFIESFAKTLVELHKSPISEAIKTGLKFLSPVDVRENLRKDIKQVKTGLGLSMEMEEFCNAWLDDISRWPSFTALTHGDLYAGHVTANADSRVTGIIDWTEAQISDVTIDFAGHLAAFDEESLKKLISAYEKLGGVTWPKFFDQVKARHFTSSIRYGVFALQTQNPDHLAAAKAQLGLA